MGVDRVIVVDVSAPLVPAEAVTTGPKILLQMVTGLMSARTEQQLAGISARDVLVRPELGDLGSAGFRDVVKGIALGEQAALAAIEKLRSFAVPEGQYLAWQRTQRDTATQEPVIYFVRVNANPAAPRNMFAIGSPSRLENPWTARRWSMTSPAHMGAGPISRSTTIS